MEKGAEPGQDGLHLTVGDHGKYDHLAASLIKYQVPFVKAVVSFARNVVDDGISGSACSIQQLSDKFQLVALHDDLDFLHWV